MKDAVNRQWRINERPSGVPERGDFELVESEVPTANTDEVLVKPLYLSVDPYMRGRMRDTESFISFGYAEPWEPGHVIRGSVVGEVVGSNYPKYEPGDIVRANLPWADYGVAKGSWLTPVNPSISPISTALGVLGDSGLTAYFGLLEVGEPKPGETVVVSGAAGSVGSIAGQIAKLCGCRVVGTAGSDWKVDWITEDLGFDVGVNYTETEDLEDALKDACPDGIDVYFDNVGGEITDAVLRLINRHARIALCGQISLYNNEDVPTGPRNEWKLIERQAKMEGFLLQQFRPRSEEAAEQLGQWVSNGDLQYRETVTKGLENAIDAFQGLFHGDNIGKQLVKVAESST